jgi:hypothetical protein
MGRKRLITLSEAERAMKVQEVILKAMSGEIKWYQAAEILGIGDRQMRRWKRHYERDGYDGLFDRRRKIPSLRLILNSCKKQSLTFRGHRSHPKVLGTTFFSFGSIITHESWAG